jgi:hypothetical protein
MKVKRWKVGKDGIVEKGRMVDPAALASEASRDKVPVY